MKSPYTLEVCMDVFDWFNDATFDYIAHVIESKIDGEERARRVLPELRKRAKWLVKIHQGTECAYPLPIM